MYRVVSLVLVILILFAPTVYAETDNFASKRGKFGALWKIDVYDSASKSYFRLILGQHHHNQGQYHEVSRRARELTFKGVRGRLAIIKSKETQKFIEQVIRPPDETWFGLAMTCRGRKFYWSDGTKLDRKNDYQNWGKRWRDVKGYVGCAPGAYFARDKLFAGMAFKRYQGVLRWWAIRPSHVTYAALVQFPTGKP